MTLPAVLVDQKHAVHVLVVVEQVLHVLEELLVVGGRFGRLGLAPFADHDGIAPLELDGFRRVLVLEGIDEVVFQIVFAEAVVFGVMAKEGGEALGLEHEAGVVRLGRHPPDGILGSRQVQVLFGLELCGGRGSEQW